MRQTSLVKEVDRNGISSGRKHALSDEHGGVWRANSLIRSTSVVLEPPAGRKLY